MTDRIGMTKREFDDEVARRQGDFHAKRNALYREFPVEAREYEDEFRALAVRLAEAERLLRRAVPELKWSKQITRSQFHDEPEDPGLIEDIDAFLADQPSALTRDWRETVNDRLKRDPEFAEEVRKAAVEAFLTADSADATRPLSATPAKP